MNQQIKETINRLTDDLFQQKEKIDDIQALTKTQIDRDFHTDLWELSERELDNEMGSRLSLMNDDIDIRKNLDPFASHRKIMAKPIRFIKRKIVGLIDFYISPMMEKQIQFNSQAVAFHLTSFIRARRADQKIAALDEKIKTLQEDHELLQEELNQMKKGLSDKTK